jgi:hypothetical protein
VARTIVIGDVHGCSAELSDLLDLLGLTDHDRVYFVGDLVARGPDSRGVLATVRRLGSRAVLGNHEQRLLHARQAKQRKERQPPLGPAHLQLLERFTDEDWAQLESLPLYLDLPEHGLRIVHAGVIPGVPIQDHDPWTLTHLRSIEASGKPSDKTGPVPWGAVYQGPPHVVFGHNAVAGIQLHPFATGLDSGCVYGRELTALVLDAGQEPPRVADRRESLVSVPAKARYFNP